MVYAYNGVAEVLHSWRLFTFLSSSCALQERFKEFMKDYDKCHRMVSG